MALFRKETVSLAVFMAVFCLSCNNEQKAGLMPEPVEPADKAAPLSKDQGLKLQGNRRSSNADTQS
jgi:hypothetical protein